MKKKKSNKHTRSVKVFSRLLILGIIAELLYIAFVFFNSYIYKAKQGGSDLNVKSQCLEEGRRYSIDEAINDPGVCDLEIAKDEDLEKLKMNSGKLINIRSIYLRKTPNTTIPSEIANLENLTLLNFHHTFNTVLPPEIGSLKKLRVLHITQADLDTLPTEIGGLSNLENLTFTFNTKKITLPQEIEKLSSLKVLALNNNPGIVLPSSLDSLVLLEELDLTNSKLNKIPEAIFNLRNLKVLNLSENNISQQETEKLKNLLPRVTLVL